MTMMEPVSQQIWDMKYRFKAPDGSPIDQSIEESWRRVARAAAAAETDPALWEARFYEALEGFQFLPAGRILAGAGTGRNVTLFNCFVMGTVPDDMGGIFEHLREAALTMQQGGGIGYDFSTLRPRGAPVHGVGADASGPLSYMDVWDAMCRTIMSAGQRRGAMMATLRCDHPDIEAFVTAKREPQRLRMFNLSVLVTDRFMEAVAKDEPWPLLFAGRTFRTVRATELWDAIMQATYDYAEPGVIFIDRINTLNNLNYCESIAATNPCVTGESWVDTAEGPRQVDDLVGKPFAAVVDGVAHPSDARGFFETGVKPVITVRTLEGYAVRLTADHPVLAVETRTRWHRTTAWREAGTLQPNDEIVLNEANTTPQWPGPYTWHEGYLIGLLVGDGTIKSDKAVLSAWPKRQVVNGGPIAPSDHDGLMAEALTAARTLPHRADFVGWIEIPGRDEWRLSLAALRKLALELGMAPGAKRITAALEQASSEFQRGFLRGFFDSDGSVMGTQQKGISVRLAQSDRERLDAVQRMLLRLGIVCSIHPRRPARETSLPDGRGGSALYPTAAQWELIVANDNIGRWAEQVGFSDTDKKTRLASLLAAYRRVPNREPFVARIASIEPSDEAAVFDVQIPGRNAFSANGIIVHNCGEQPLPPYGACLLGSINLAALVERPFAADAALDLVALDRLVPVAVRLLDNVIDISRFPLVEQREEAEAKRRVGLGVTGLADALILCGARYGSPRAVELTAEWLAAMQRAAYRASAELAREKGAFPLFEAAYLDGETPRQLDPEIRALIAEYGIRNALLTSIAPTGTISLLANNVSSGLEPVFSFRSNRNILLADGTRQQVEVTDYALTLFRRLHGETAPLPDAFVDTAMLLPADHLKMQAVAQRFVDSSISKTINVPKETPFEVFKTVYEEAYALGCKGCTTYRPNDITGSVLSVAVDAQENTLISAGPPLSRPETLPGQTYKLRWPESDHAIYITVNDILEEGLRRPFEVFINSKNMDHYAWTVGLTRMISAVFRRGGDVAFVVEELKAVFDPRGGAWLGGRYVPSLLAAIGDVIERHMVGIGFLAARPAGAHQGAMPAEAGSRLDQCPRCGTAALVHQEGCVECLNCGFSKCG